jgi:hypothetical protein
MRLSGSIQWSTPVTAQSNVIEMTRTESLSREARAWCSNAARLDRECEGNPLLLDLRMSPPENSQERTATQHILMYVHTLSMGGGINMHADQTVIAAELNQQIVASTNARDTRRAQRNVRVL